MSMGRAIINQSMLLMDSVQTPVKNILAEGLQTGNLGLWYSNMETSAVVATRTPLPTDNGAPPPQPSAVMVDVGGNTCSPYVL